MKAVFQIALGVIAAIGGFVDIGDLVFNAQAGATLGYSALWAMPVGVLGIIVFAEMSGRIVAISKKPNFVLVRERYSPRLATCDARRLPRADRADARSRARWPRVHAELLLRRQRRLLRAGRRWSSVAAAAAFLPFGGIERIFGYSGLALAVYLAASIKLDPQWSQVGNGFVPEVHTRALYWYFVVGLIAAALMPYEIYFYSSGAVEERWTAAGPEGEPGQRDHRLRPRRPLQRRRSWSPRPRSCCPPGSVPDSIGTVALVAESPYGEAGLILALVGMLFAVGGATIDTAFSAAYNLAQHQGWKWGKRLRPAAGATLHAVAGRLRAARLRDRPDRRRPDRADRVRGDLLDPGASAHLSADPARRRRPRA